MKRSKNYKQKEKLVTKKSYTIEEAMALLPKITLSKFAGTVGVDILLNLSEKQKKESIRGSYILKNKFGKDIKVLAFVETGKERDIKGADIVGNESLIPSVEKGEVEFDIILAEPQMMPKIARLGKVIGSRGLMPNPKNGTVTTDINAAILKFKAGTKNYKVNDNAQIKLLIGDLTLTPEQLVENYNELIALLKNDLKKIGDNVLKRAIITITMGKPLKVSM